MMRYALPIVLAVALAGCKHIQQSKNSPVESSIDKLIPGDTVILARAHFEEIKKSPLYTRLIAGQKIEVLDDFARKSGLDPRRDLIELVIASNGREAVTIARGRIPDAAPLEALLEKEGARRFKINEFNMLGNEEGAVSFLDGGLVVAGRTPHLRRVLGTPAGDDSKKRAVMAQAATVGKDKPIWAVATAGFAPMPLPETGNLANLGQVFRSIENVAMSIDLTTGFNLAATGICSTDKDAKGLHDLLRGLIGFGRLSTPTDRPEMLRFFDGIKVDHTERTVKLNADVPMDLVEYFIRITGNRRPAA